MAMVTCGTGPEFATAQRAADWVGAFYPDVTATLDGQAVQLVASERDDVSLRLIWQCALANEASLSRGASRRAALIEALVR